MISSAPVTGGTDMNSRRWYLIDRGRSNISRRTWMTDKYDECIGHRVQHDRPSWLIMDDEDEIY